MSGHNDVRPATIAKARELGTEMVRDAAIRPQLKNVAQYGGYGNFRVAHRALWEQSDRFELYYQERLHALADKESRRQAIDDSESTGHWDARYDDVLYPIKAAMWETWEKAVNLERRYFQALLDSGSMTPEQVQTIIHSDDERPRRHVPMAVAGGGAIPSILRFLHLSG